MDASRSKGWMDASRSKGWMDASIGRGDKVKDMIWVMIHRVDTLCFIKIR
jgi:hypothetical protein